MKTTNEAEKRGCDQQESGVGIDVLIVRDYLFRITKTAISVGDEISPL